MCTSYNLASAQSKTEGDTFSLLVIMITNEEKCFLWCLIDHIVFSVQLFVLHIIYNEIHELVLDDMIQI